MGTFPVDLGPEAEASFGASSPEQRRGNWPLALLRLFSFSVLFHVFVEPNPRFFEFLLQQ